MKTKLTKDIENCFLREFATMGTFICPEVGINIKRYGVPYKYYKSTKLTEQEMIDKGYKQIWHTDLEIVDMLVWLSNKNIWKCFEIKVSLSDFKSNCAKTFIGNYNYYILPNTLIPQVENLIPKDIGIYSYNVEQPQYRWQHRISNYRKSKRKELGCEYSEIYYAMIKSLYRQVDKYRNQFSDYNV